MKKIIFAVFVFGLSIVGTANATVGGSDYIYNLKYNPQNESVYYVRVSESGRGCPPEIMKLSLATGEVVTEFDCSEMEKLLREELNNNYSLLNTVITNIISGYKDLIELNLAANQINFDVSYLKDEFYGDINNVDRVLYNRTFDVDVYQNGVKVDKFQVRSCSIDTPFVFAGYIIPGFEKKIAVLISGGGDCVEGPYTSEAMRIVSGVQIDFRQSGVVSTKARGALVPSEKTLTVKASDEFVIKKDIKPSDIQVATSVTSTTGNMSIDGKVLEVVYLLIAGAIAIFVGILIGRKTKKNSNSL